MTGPKGTDTTAALAWVVEAAGPLAHVDELTGGWTSTMLAITTRRREDLVLRLMTEEPWRTHGSGLTRRERDVQVMLAGTPLPVPRSRALDETGAAAGHPAHLMTRLPGALDVDRVDGGSLHQLVGFLAGLHEFVPEVAIRSYQSWAWEAKYVVPTWASDAGVWADAFAVLRETPPPFESCLIHRDFHLRNVLWDGPRLSGVVDWVETSMGPAWLDVAHCRTNLALDHGEEVAAWFAEAYTERTGRVPQPYFDVMDVVGFLPPPGRTGFVTTPLGRRRLEDRLRDALRSVALAR